MELSLQELVEAAARDLEARSPRRRRPVQKRRGGERAPVPGVVRIVRTIPIEGAICDRPRRRSIEPVEAPVPYRRYLAGLTVGVVLLAAGWLGLSWASAAAQWREEARGQRRELIMQRGMILHGQIRALNLQAARLEERARTLVQYATDLRYSFYGGAGDRELAQADAVLADRERLLAEIAARRRQLADLRQQAAALHSQP